MNVEMSVTGRSVTLSIKALLHFICKIRVDGLHRIPHEGPGIVVVNHINFLEVPLIYTLLYPRRTSSLVKIETWDNPVLGRLADLWDAIPLRRDATDFTALRTAEVRLKEKQILMIAPEGTRSYNGIIQRGNPGVVTLALRSGAPLYPLVHFGGEMFWSNFKRFRRTEVTVKIGQPFVLKPSEGRVNRGMRQDITDEIMHYLASLMPEKYRGEYGQSPKGEYKYLSPYRLSRSLAQN